MLVTSLTEVGAARSIVIDEDNGILAGGGVARAAAEAGITRVQVVEADGATLIAVRRRGLSVEQKRALAIYDNRTAELAEWNVEQLADDRAHGLEFTPYFDDGEVRKLLRVDGRTAAVTEVPTDDVGDRFWIAIRGPLKAQAAALQRIRAVLKDLADVDVDLGTVQLQASDAWTG